MPIQTVEPRRLYRQIADQLRVLIQNGEFGIGMRLPPERDLAVKLGVSRPSVREALIALEVDGLVEIRMGSGIYVTAREPKRRVETAHGPLEIIRARALIEAELAAAAARSEDASLASDLEQTLRDMEADIALGKMPIDGDRAFHLRIAQASDNAPLLEIVQRLFDERNGPLFAQLGSHFERDRTWKQALAEHRAVAKAIARHDPVRARAAMVEHLERSHERFSAAWTQPADAEPAGAESAMKVSAR
jgi:GntR family transcriptional regulator, transcriptional repressor for pyruvate dehydrogenase complex